MVSNVTIIYDLSVTKWNSLACFQTDFPVVNPTVKNIMDLFALSSYHNLSCFSGCVGYLADYEPGFGNRLTQALAPLTDTTLWAVPIAICKDCHWQLNVNDRVQSKSMDDIKIKGHDNIVWKLIKGTNSP